tara:strand:+ start:1381 stop:1530 length:150 start_codon:yes stop_codon:yes gene_type:complete
MKITKEQILKMIQEEVDKEIREGFFSRLFGGGDDKEITKVIDDLNKEDK